MSWLLRVLFFVIFLLALIACTPSAGGLQSTPTAIVSAPTLLAPTRAVSISTGLDASRAMEHNRMLAVTIGSRVAGSENGAHAGDYIAQQFASYGYTVEQQAFTFEPWEDLGTRVTMTAPDARDLEAQPLQFSPAGHLEAEIVAIGGVGNADDFAKANVRNKIALVQRGTVVFSDKAKNAASAGARAVLIYNNASGLYGGTLRDRVAIPAIALSGKDGQNLLGALSNGVVKIRIDSDTQITQKTGHNIVATKRGSSDKTIVLGGHYDSVAAGPGANDNGSGTAVLIELARVLAQRDTKNTLIFIAFDAEEFGLIGSRYYVDHLTDSERAKITAMLNFDMLGGGSGPLLVGSDGPIGLMARQAASELGIESRNFQLGNNAGSDHQAFTRFGIDTVFFSRDYDLLHTPRDVIGEVREQFLAEAGVVAMKTVEMLEAK